jgi:hypothetical protein
MLCVIITIVFFSSWLNFKSKLIRSFSDCGSSPAVGSSRIKNCPPTAIVPASATLLFSPPESPKGDKRRYFSPKPTSEITFLAISVKKRR